MNARLARKLIHTPVDRMSPYWRLQFLTIGIRDHRIMKALTKIHGGRCVEELLNFFK